jgi:DNA-binding CsgD family transcriptional regulator
MAMPTRSHVPGSQRQSPEFVGRRRELEVLSSFLDDVRGGNGRVLVMVGGPGVGKTALFDHLCARAAGCRVETGAGVESEMELPFAGLHQLLTPMLGGIERLPAPQREALQTAFGISSGAAPDRFLVGLATLSLLSDRAEAEPLCCFVDDLHWLDRASAQVLAFVGRRLRADQVGLLFASRARLRELAGFDELRIDGLAEADARTLLDSVLTTPIDARIRDRVIAEADGNPLALLELFRGLTAADLAGGFGLTGAVPVTASLEIEFRDRLGALPASTRTLLLVAAADPVGDPALVWQAARALGVEPDAAVAAVEANLVEFAPTVRFRHPLVRSAVYRSASARQRQAAHRALAEATDAALDPDRRAWHRAQGAAGPDEDVAAELEQSAGRAQARGGIAAAAAFLTKAFQLTSEPARRAERALAAAQAKVQSGAPAEALGLLVSAEAGPLTEVDRARADLVRAQTALASNRGSDASLLMLNAARRLQHVDVELARVTYLDALKAALFAGRLARAQADLRSVSRAALTLPAPRSSSSVSLLLEGWARNFAADSFSEGYAAGLPLLRRALADSGDGLPPEQALSWLQGAYGMSRFIWDEEQNHLLAARWATLVREVGALSELHFALTAQILTHVLEGDLAAASSVLEELQAAAEAAQANVYPHGPMALAAYRGDHEQAAELIPKAIADATERGEGLVVSSAQWASAVLNNGAGLYPEASAAAQRASQDPWALGFRNLSLVELAEATVHTGSPELAADACSQIADLARSAGTDWALGLEARSLALAAQGQEAEAHYRTAINLLSRTRIRPDHARARLLYGEWLRRENRRADAREQLRTAYEMLSAMGMAGFAERARRELLATGETVRKRASQTTRQLTSQEASIARLAAEGLTNPEIGTRLFISTRTVQYHLAKVFQKLQINSRGQLHRVLPRS